jgi:lipoprotein-anchoring transpeptidase ErfK/SrfK
MHMQVRRGAAAVAAVLVTLAASDAAAARTVVHIREVAPVYTSPGGPPLVAGVTTTAERGAAWVVQRRGPWLGIPTRFRPHGLLGWVHDTPAMRFTNTSTVVRVDLSRRRVLVTQAGRLLMAAQVVTGAAGSPTPVASTSVSTRITVTRASGYSASDYGPMIIGLRLWQPLASPGRPIGGMVAFHGGGARTIGTASSGGCFRMRNGDVLRLARFVRPGTPVIIAR